MQRVRSKFALAALGAALATLALPSVAVDFSVTPLVTDDQAAHPAQITDPDLKNAWGISYGPTTPFWISDNGSGRSTLYRVDPLTQATTKQALVVTIPGDGSVTGQVFNGNSSAFGGNRFLFVSEDGTVSGWQGAFGSTAAIMQSPSADNVYKGAALATINTDTYLYAANFRSGKIDVLKGDDLSPGLTGNFTDPNLPSGYAPFNIQNLGGSLYVAYALQDSQGRDEVAGAGLGIVDKFDLQGNLIGRVAAGGALNAPWGLAIAPSSFGAQAGSLLVGNFGDGRINLYDAATNAFLGQVNGANGMPLAIDGLWALAPGNGGSGGSSDLLYFTAGPDNETHGLFGVLAVPEPASAVLMLCGIAAIGTWPRVARARRRG
jgi:uncharacterized protein (TIGR03118 family)